MADPIEQAKPFVQRLIAAPAGFDQAAAVVAAAFRAGLHDEVIATLQGATDFAADVLLSDCIPKRDR